MLYWQAQADSTLLISEYSFLVYGFAKEFYMNLEHQESLKPNQKSNQ